ncbi:MAG: type IX secretion system protein PorQ [Chitinophagales bacterium]
MRLTLLTCFVILSLPIFAQFGGSYTYSYLQLPPSARIAALSGLNITTYDSDINFAYQNPALLNPQMDGRLSLSDAMMPGKINQGYAAYAIYKENWNATMGGGIFYRAIGTIPRTDVNGDFLGSFGGGEYVANWGIAYGQNKLHYGVNAKLLYSHLESYNSFGIAADIGAAYIDTAKLFSAGLVLRNMGTQIKPYTENNNEELPFSIDFGVSKRLKHLPLRLSITLHDLQTFDIRYDDPIAIVDVNIFGADSTTTEKKYTVDKIAQHLNVGGEFYFGKNVMVRIGYDHMTRKELSIETHRGLTGFSMGFGFKINKYSIDYGHEFYSLAGGSNFITVAANLGEVFR